MERFTKKNCKTQIKKSFNIISIKDSEPIFSEWGVKVELELSNYATKSIKDSKNATGVDTWNFLKKVELANLKSDEDKLDIDKLKNVPTNLSNLESKVHKLDVDKLVPAPVV